MANTKKISTESAYKKVMTKIDTLMIKGSKNVTKTELSEIRKLALAAQNYEANKFVIDAPSTLTGMIEMKMYENKLRQKDVARQLNVSPAKLSLIMSGKQKPDINFLKALHTKLNVDANFLLTAI